MHKSTDFATYVSADAVRQIDRQDHHFHDPPEQFNVVASLLSERAGTEQDVLCLNAGTGAVAHYLATRFPAWNVTATDEVAAFAEATARHAASSRYRFKPTAVAEEPTPERFDIVTDLMRLLHLSDWKAELRRALALCRRGGRVIISGLFNEHDTDILTTALEVAEPVGQAGHAVQYNCFSAVQVERFLAAEDIGAHRFEAFDISIDLPHPGNRLGTYTRRSAAGRRIQISGGIHMQWRFLIIDR